MALGYNKPLFLLPFDHRSTFAKNLFGLSGNIKKEQKDLIRDYKVIIYDAFKLAISSGIPKENSAILIDEEYGEQILIDAGRNGITTCLTVEKSGQDEFDFEYGEKFGVHIKKINPNFVKALVRYNPLGDSRLNLRQRKKLKILSDFCHKEGYKFLLEPLVPNNVKDFKLVGDVSKGSFDKEVRPQLTLRMIREMQESGVEPDIWKIEGMWDRADYEKVVAVTRNSLSRKDVGVIILGRGEEKKDVISWIETGRGVPGVIGTAIGRTIFFEPLFRFKNGLADRDTTVKKIAENYKYFYDIFNTNNKL